MRTDSIRSHAPMSVMGSRSLANPGSMPDVKHDVPPSRQAASRRSTICCTASSPPRGWTSGTIDVDTTFIPAARMRQMSSSASSGPEVGGRGVADALGVGGEQRVDVVGRGHADRVEVGELAGVAPDLLRASGPRGRRARARGGG